ncbi:MAG: hypothetical protein M3014_05065, partial [Chloroflexota bacterium]|nr:hypothetical protein [Chloroflexota bacterium]
MRELAEEEVHQRINRIKALIGSHTEEALRLIEQMEVTYCAAPNLLPPGVRYLIPLSKAGVYLQDGQPEQARVQLEMALVLAGSDVEARVRSLNLLGVVFYEQGQHSVALQHHLECVYSVVGATGAVRDLSFRLSVYQNLANDYRSLQAFPQAIVAYKKALHILDDLNDPQRQAELFWGMALSYKALSWWRYARLYVMRAIQIYRAAGNRTAEAVMQIILADVLLAEGGPGGARGVEGALNRAADLFSGRNKEEPRRENEEEKREAREGYGALSFMYRYYAELKRREGKLEEAALQAAESIRQAEMLLRVGQPTGSPFWVDPGRTY